uniref:Uncharacterized protein n=1 Tax=Plectus sambesii TaxID=2011161 RepID=A0A914X0S0_9BILA
MEKTTHSRPNWPTCSAVRSEDSGAPTTNHLCTARRTAPRRHTHTSTHRIKGAPRPARTCCVTDTSATPSTPPISATSTKATPATQSILTTTTPATPSASAILTNPSNSGNCSFWLTLAEQQLSGFHCINDISNTIDNIDITHPNTPCASTHVLNYLSHAVDRHQSDTVEVRGASVQHALTPAATPELAEQPARPGGFIRALIGRFSLVDCTCTADVDSYHSIASHTSNDPSQSSITIISQGSIMLLVVVCSISSMRLVQSVQWCAPRLTRQSSGSVKFVDIPNCHCSCERCGHHGCPSNPHVLFVDRSEFIAAASRATNSPLFFRPITPTPPALTFSTERGPSQMRGAEGDIASAIER